MPIDKVVNVVGLVILSIHQYRNMARAKSVSNLENAITPTFLYNTNWSRILQATTICNCLWKAELSDVPFALLAFPAVGSG